MIKRSESEPVVGKYRKRATKRKPWVIQWEWTGDKTDLTKLQKTLYENTRQRYATERQAAQALSDWEKGRGIYGQVLTKKNGWKAHIILLNVEVAREEGGKRS